MKQLAEIGLIFDWVTPLIGIFQDLWNDPTPLQSNSWTFFFDYDQALANGWNGNAIEKLLNENGVKTWGKQLTFGTGEFFLCTNREQAEFAEYLLLRNGIPVMEKSLGVPNANA